MGRIVDMPLPRLGETMEEGRITAWLKQPGEAFKRGETILEVETDKTVVEVPALLDGILREQVAGVDDRIAIDGVIARIEVEGAIAEPPPSGETATPPPPRKSSPPPPRRAGEETSRVAASTAARRFAQRNNVTLEAIPGTGRRGRISLADLRPADVPDHLDLPQGRVALKSWKPSGVPVRTAFLIHGLFADAESWSVFARELARRGWLVIAPDLPAHGATEAAFKTLDDIVDIAGTAIAQSARGKVTLVGHSFGALVAARLAARPGAKFNALLLIAPAGFGTNAAQAFAEGMLTARSASEAGHALMMLGAGPASSKVCAALAAHLVGNHDGLARAAAFLDDPGPVQDIAGISCPATAVFARDDQIVPVTDALNAPANIAVRFTEGSGHVPHWFKAAWLADLLERPAGQ